MAPLEFSKRGRSARVHLVAYARIEIEVGSETRIRMRRTAGIHEVPARGARLAPSKYRRAEGAVVATTIVCFYVHTALFSA